MRRVALDSPPLDAAPETDRLAREREFHDELATGMDPAAMPPHPLDGLEVGALESVGSLAGKRVLDLGCGAGDLSIALLARGAEVTAVDLSPGMVEIARERIRIHSGEGARVELVATAVESLPFADDCFDVAVGRFVLHHLDLAVAGAQIARVLAPGGVAIFVENSGRNKLLMWARDNLAGRFGIPRFGTVDERPLVDEDLEFLRAAFSRVELDYPRFDFFTIFDRQVLRYRWKPVTRLCHGLDSLIWRVAPPLRKYSFRVVVRAVA